MSEELLQRDLLNNPDKIGKWNFYNIGATSVKALKGNDIIRDIDYGKLEKRKVDGLLVLRKNVVAIVEYKTPKEFNTKAKREKAIKQELDVAQKLKAEILIATDTKETIWINVSTGNRVKDENGEFLKTNFDPKDEKLPELIDKIKASINKNNDQIKPKTLINPTDLAKQIWQATWIVSGATPENSLYTFVELFIFKYLSDLGVLTGGNSFDNLYENFKTNTKEEVLEMYANTIRRKIKTLFPANSVDKTTIINGSIFVNKDQSAVKGYSEAFKSFLAKFKNYDKLENIDRDFKSQLFESFLKESISKKNWGQFFTPLKVVRAVASMAKDDIKAGIKICDPACGVGKFLLEPIVDRLDEFYEVKKGKLTSNITIHGFDKGFDKDEQKTIILAKANMLIYFSDIIKENPNITKEFSDLFNESFILKTNSILGTLSEPIENEYDLILTNPPYVASGSSNLKDEIKKNGNLVNYYKVNATGVEGLFMEWIIRALKPLGKAFIIIPDGILDRRNDKIRKLIIEQCYLDGIISLPTKTFFTTPKKTYILCITKKADIKNTQKEPVYTHLVSEIGESRDVYRFDIEEDDLTEAVIYFNQFKGAKQHFKTSNQRCKIQPIDKFIEENDWSIDRWWTKDEKIELGILEEDKKIKFEEMPDLLQEVANNIMRFREDVLAISEAESDVNSFENIILDDIFDFPPIKGLTKKFINSNKGNIPVYGGKIQEEPIGYVADKLSEAKYFENCLAWNREGSVGYVFWHKHKFTTNDHHRPLIVQDEYKAQLHLPYLRKVLQDMLLEQGFAWSKTASKEKVRKLSIKIPINSKGEFDIEVQKEIAEKYRQIEQVKSSIISELDKITDTQIDFE